MVKKKKTSPTRMRRKSDPPTEAGPSFTSSLVPDGIDRRPDAIALLAGIKAKLPELKDLLAQSNDEWCYEDGVYRFYHQSFKVYARLQDPTRSIVVALQALAPARPLNEAFMRIVDEGTSRRFELADNQHWSESTRPIVEAFFHARYFLEMVCRYGAALDAPPAFMPSGWAAVLYLYNLR